MGLFLACRVHEAVGSDGSCARSVRWERQDTTARPKAKVIEQDAVTLSLLGHVGMRERAHAGACARGAPERIRPHGVRVRARSWMLPRALPGLPFGLLTDINEHDRHDVLNSICEIPNTLASWIKFVRQSKVGGGGGGRAHHTPTTDSGTGS